MASARTKATEEEKEQKRAERQRLRDAEARHSDVERNGSKVAKEKARDILVWNRRRESELTEEIEETAGSVR